MHVYFYIVIGTIQEFCGQVEIIIHRSCVEKMVMSLDSKIGLRNTLVHD
jgi:hypothetical protein